MPIDPFEEGSETRRNKANAESAETARREKEDIGAISSLNQKIFQRLKDAGYSSQVLGQSILVNPTKNVYGEQFYEFIISASKGRFHIGHSPERAHWHGTPPHGLVGFVDQNVLDEVGVLRYCGEYVEYNRLYKLENLRKYENEALVTKEKAIEDEKEKKKDKLDKILFPIKVVPVILALAALGSFLN